MPEDAPVVRKYTKHQAEGARYALNAGNQAVKGDQNEPGNGKKAASQQFDYKQAAQQQ